MGKFSSRSVPTPGPVGCANLGRSTRRNTHTIVRICTQSTMRGRRSDRGEADVVARGGSLKVCTPDGISEPPADPLITSSASVFITSRSFAECADRSDLNRDRLLIGSWGPPIKRSVAGANAKEV